MGKKKDKAAKAAAEQNIEPAELSKKERKALKAREADLEAQLAAKAVEKKAAKKAKKKGKASVPTDGDTAATADIQPPEAEAIDTAHTPEQIIAAAYKVLADKGASPGAIASANKALSKALEGMSDDDLKARVVAKRQAREDLLATADGIDRDDAEAVKAYNEALAAIGGGRYLTSAAELDREAARLKGKPTGNVEEADDAEREALADTLDAAVAALNADEADGMGHAPETAALVAKASKKAKRKAKPDELVVEIETEHGREFLAGPADAVDEQTGEVSEFAKPSDAPKTDFETNGNGQYKIKRLTDGKLVGYTRTTTYISNLESTAQLESWKLRILLEGIAANDTPDEDGKMPEPIVARVRDLTHVRDTAIAKARRRDRKGKLAVGELAPLVDDAWKAYKRALDELAHHALDLGGAKEAATKGTDIHALCELYDREGIDAVGDLLTEGKITPADLADVEAYARAIEAAGIKIDRDNIERVIVSDVLKVAGRLDRAALVRLPGSARAVRMVADIKTGRIDYSAGKIAQQLEMYASAKGYDLNTHERTDLKLSRTKAVLIHLPAGTATCSIYVVDLGIGRIGNKLSGEVREWRNVGKRAIDTTVDLAKPEAVAS